MALLQSGKYPHIRVWIPELKQYRVFKAGRLDIDESDPAFEAIMKWAAARSFVTVHETVLRCSDCNEPFAGGMAKARFARHNNEKHEGTAEIVDAGGQKRVKVSVPFACDICQPPQAFENDEQLAEHAAAFHATGDETEGPSRQPAVRQGVTTSGGVRKR